jgi:hypothetical protein
VRYARRVATGRSALAAAIAVALGYAWVAGHFSTFTVPAAVATFVPGAIGMVAAVRLPPSRRCRPDRAAVGWWAWAAIAGVALAIELTTLALGASHAHPTVSDLTNPWLSHTPGRAAAFALWLGLGWWIVKR